MRFLKRYNILAKTAAAFLLLALLAVQTAGAQAEAEGATDDSPKDVPKEESIYASLSGDGSFKGAYVINEFLLDEPGVVVDYGMYDSVKSLVAAESMTVGNGEIRVKAPAGRFYYQGNLKSLELPWLFSISYLLDGKEVKADDLSGAEGYLQIKIKIRKNPEAKGEFYKYYAVQTAITLDAEICTDIEAEGGIVTGAGKNKLVTFTMLPGSEADYDIKTSVKNFYMDGIQFSAVPLATGIDIPDADTLDDKASQLTDAVKSLDDGAQNLDEGAEKLVKGAGRLKDGIESMQSGMAEMMEGLRALDEKSPELAEGSATIRDGLTALQNGLGQFYAAFNGLTELTAGSAGIKNGISGLSDGLSRLSGSFEDYRKHLSQSGTDTVDVLISNERMISELTARIKELEAKLETASGESAETAELRSQVAVLGQVVALLRANSGIVAADKQFIEELEKGISSAAQGSFQLKSQYETFDREIAKIPTMLDGLPEKMAQIKESVDALKKGCERLHAGLGVYFGGVNELAGGSLQLYSGYQSIAKGYDGLYAGILELSEGAGKLADGTGEMRRQTALLAGNLNAAYGNILNSIAGKIEPASYISEKNTNVRSVQFIMKTEAIEKKQPASEKSEPETRPGFWEKLLDLFRLKK